MCVFVKLIVYARPYFFYPGSVYLSSYSLAVIQMNPTMQTDENWYGLNISRAQ